ncbi:MAG: sensor histidine kinase [Woeseia sp.]
MVQSRMLSKIGDEQKRELLWSPIPLVVIFVAVSLVWILGTDWLVQHFVSDPELASGLQTVKGIVYIGLIAVLIFFLLSRARKSLRAMHQRVLDEQRSLESRVQERTKELLESYMQLRMLARRLDVMRDTERKNLSRELHDQMGSDITGLKLDLVSIRDQFGDADSGVVASIDAALELVDSIYKSVRDLAAKLRPAILDDFGLVAGIEALVDDFRGRAGCQTELRIDIGEIARDESRDMALYRICQESLTNILKHAGAVTDVQIRMSIDKGNIKLMIEDNGAGPGPLRDRPESQVGVVGMRERAAAVGGSCIVTAREGGGTAVRADVPLARTVHE